MLVNFFDPWLNRLNVNREYYAQNRFEWSISFQTKKFTTFKINTAQSREQTRSSLG
jgi:hypothetical protein